MIDFYLRFPDEATARELLGEALDANREAEDGSMVLACFTATHALSLIGEIVLPPETEGGEPIALEGFHANLRFIQDDATLPEALASFVVYPSQPARVWA
jgi:hypothetical protein